MTTPEPKPPSFSPAELIDLYKTRRHDELSRQLLTILRRFDEASYTHLEPQGSAFVDAFVELFLKLFIAPDYQPDAGQLADFVRLNPTISNLAAMSRFGTTDAFLNTLLSRPSPVGKILALYSCRNAQTLDRKRFFDADPFLSSVWYGAYADLYRSGLIREGVAARLGEHFVFGDDRLDFGVCSLDGYFASTYVGDGSDRRIKPVINRAMQEAGRGATIRCRPDPRKIAVFSGNWSRVHSVYRIVFGYVEALRDTGYHLTFFPLNARSDADRSIFHEVRALAFDAKGMPDVSMLQDHDFMVAFYPDVGLTPASIRLANLRIAPIQVAALGHSVSTFGSEIDCWISGSDAEPPIDPQRNYSERLILLPGAGAVHCRPEYTPTGRRKPGETFVINGPWNAQKVNHAFGRTLAELVRRSTRPIKLRVFVSASLNRKNDYVPFVRDLENLVGRDAIEVVGPLPYQEYMALMEEGGVSLDSYPFGGCNTVADSLFLRKLTVVREGDQWYNRIGGQMLRLVGLPELVATTEAAFLDIAHQLIHDDPYRARLQTRLDEVDLDATIFSKAEARQFVEAIGDEIRRNLSADDTDSHR